MAEAVATHFSQGTWEVWSAGSRPSGSVHPIAVQLMKEVGLNVSQQHSKGVEVVPKREWDYVVTMGCGDACPAVNARHRLDWTIPDPVGLSLNEARAIRDDLIARVRALLEAPPGSA